MSQSSSQSAGEAPVSQLDSKSLGQLVRYYWVIQLVSKLINQSSDSPSVVGHESYN